MVWCRISGRPTGRLSPAGLTLVLCWLPCPPALSLCPLPSALLPPSSAHLPPCSQDDLSLPPLRIVGYEGLFGSAFMLVVVLPVLQFLPGPEGAGLHEDSLDTLHVSAVQLDVEIESCDPRGAAGGASRVDECSSSSSSSSSSVG